MPEEVTLYCFPCQEPQLCKDPVIHKIQVMGKEKTRNLITGSCVVCGKPMSQLTSKESLSMPRRDRVAFIGPKGAGKSTIAEAWTKLVGGTKFEFSDAGKIEVARALAINAIMNLGDYNWGQPGTWGSIQNEYDLIRREMENPNLKDKYVLPLQVWLTEFRRAEDPEYWVKRGESRIRSTSSPIAIVLRFDNELEMLGRYDFTVVRLAPGPTTRDIGERVLHESEGYWPLMRYDLELEYQPGLENQARRLIEEYGLDGSQEVWRMENAYATGYSVGEDKSRDSTVE